MTEWKPGMVAATEYRGVESRAFVVEGFSCPEGHPRRPHWHGPLVVLDLGDNPLGRHEGARHELLRSLRAEGTMTGGWLADQIEQQTRPPKPAEPKGLGAVVEDARGDFWVYTGLRNAKDGETRLWFHGSLPADYADINAVKVLSEGVQS